MSTPWSPCCGVMIRSPSRMVRPGLLPDQLLHLHDGVEHPAGHVLEGRLHRGRRLAADHQPVGVPLLLDEDRLGGGRAAVGGQDRPKLGHPFADVSFFASVVLRHHSPVSRRPGRTHLRMRRQRGGSPGRPASRRAV